MRYPLWKSFDNIDSIKCGHVYSDQQSANPLVAKNYVSLWENDLTSHLIYELSKQFYKEFMVSIISFMSSPTQQDVHFVNWRPILSKMSRALGRG